MRPSSVSHSTSTRGDLNPPLAGRVSLHPEPFSIYTFKGKMNTYRPIHSNRENAQTIVTKRHPEAGCLIAWTDGACEPNPGFGGWGYRLEFDGNVLFEDSGGEAGTTNNRMELSAIVEAVAYSDTRPIIIRTDSQLCVLCAVGRWKRKTNLDLWRALAAHCSRREVIFEWWRGHCGTPGNERADELAQIGRLSAMPTADNFYG